MSQRDTVTIARNGERADMTLEQFLAMFRACKGGIDSRTGVLDNYLELAGEVHVFRQLTGAGPYIVTIRALGSRERVITTHLLIRIWWEIRDMADGVVPE